MAKKLETKAMKPDTRPIRLDLPPEVHKALRRAAAEADMSMVKFAQLALIKALEKK